MKQIAIISSTMTKPTARKKQADSTIQKVQGDT